MGLPAAITGFSWHSLLLVLLATVYVCKRHPANSLIRHMFTFASDRLQTSALSGMECRRANSRCVSTVEPMAAPVAFGEHDAD